MGIWSYGQFIQGKQEGGTRKLKEMNGNGKVFWKLGSGKRGIVEIIINDGLMDTDHVWIKDLRF